MGCTLARSNQSAHGRPIAQSDSCAAHNHLLLNLPGELRTMVYQHIFQRNEVRSLLRFPTDDRRSWSQVVREDMRKRLSVLLVCRQIYQDARQLAVESLCFSQGCAKTAVIVPETVGAMLQHLDPLRKVQLRKLSFSISYESTAEYCEALNNENIKTLANLDLETISIYVERSNNDQTKEECERLVGRVMRLITCCYALTELNFVKWGHFTSCEPIAGAEDHPFQSLRREFNIRLRSLESKTTTIDVSDDTPSTNLRLPLFVDGEVVECRDIKVTIASAQEANSLGLL